MPSSRPSPAFLADNLDHCLVLEALAAVDSEGLEAGATKAALADPLAIERAVASITTDDEEHLVIIDRDRFPVLLFGAIIICVSKSICSDFWSISVTQLVNLRENDNGLTKQPIGRKGQRYDDDLLVLLRLFRDTRSNAITTGMEMKKLILINDQYFVVSLLFFSNIAQNCGKPLFQ